jgi:MoxR-like ATPase
MVKMALGYPDGEAEVDMLRLSADPVIDLEPVVSLGEFLNMRRLVEEIHAGEAVLRYVVSVTDATQTRMNLSRGLSAGEPYAPERRKCLRSGTRTVLLHPR